MIVSESPNWPAAVKSTGLDSIFIDTEHIAQNRVKQLWMCHLYSALGVGPVVRIPSPNPYLAAMVRERAVRRA